MQKHLSLLMSLCTLAAGLSAGCGKQEFVKKDFTSSAASAGLRQLAPKVDIVIGIDNSGSMTSAVTETEQALRTFVSSIQSQFWNYRVGKIQFNGATQSNSLNQILVNPIYNNTLLPDGSVNQDPIISGNYPYTGQVYALNDANQFSLTAGVSFANNPTTDIGLTTIRNRLSQSLADTNEKFLRSQATLAVVLITNGAASELLNTASDPFSGYSTTKINNMVTSYRSLKTGMRFYAVTSPSYTQNCQGTGGQAYSGQGYLNMADLLNSPFLVSSSSTNICSINAADAGNTAVNSILSSIGADLQRVTQSYIYSRLVFNFPITVQRVFKNGVELPANGWSYKGYQSNVPTVTGIRDENGNELAFEANFTSGFVIELYGSSRMFGSDVPTVDYQQ